MVEETDMTTLIVLGSIGAYLAVAGLIARRAVATSAFEDRADRLQSFEQWRREELQFGALMGVFWPLVLLYLVVAEGVCRPVGNWLWKPVQKREDRTARLKADRAAWVKKGAAASSDEEKRMAADVVESLDEILRGAR
jgi:hypothetical protein